MFRTSIARKTAFVLAAGFTVFVTSRADADSFASSASSAGSESSGSSSTSLHKSSNSSSGDRRGEQVDYRIVAIDDAADHPGHARLTLQAADPDDRLTLDVPRAVAQREAFGPGDVVTARKRVYGWAFARGGEPEPFFLVIADDWQTRFAPRRVS
jgi:hypothetical protein